jgi:glycosyltransferase involved in cell wall biosynthesis
VIFREILKAYRPYLASVCLATDSARLADEYRDLSGMELTVFPSPRIWPAIIRRFRASCDDPVTISSLGPARHEKGTDVLIEGIREHAKRYPNDCVRYLIQWGKRVTRSDGSKLEPPNDLKNVTCLHDALTSADYEKYFEQTDCMILPYRRESYFARISGLGLEAFTAGIPVIYTRDSWMEDSAKVYGAGIGLKQLDAAEIAEAIHAMASNIDEYRRAAAANAPKARECHSPETFMKCLWGS